MSPLFNLLRFHHLFVAANQLHQVNAFGKVAYVIVLAFGSLERLDFFAKEVKDNDLPYSICIVLDKDIVSSWIRKNR